MAHNPYNLPIDTVPGTVHLVDLEHKMHTRHAGGTGDVVLVPTPSDDPDDPLNWSPKRKFMSTATLAMYDKDDLSIATGQ